MGESTPLLVAVFGFLGMSVAPIVVALINRGGKSDDEAENDDAPVNRHEFNKLMENYERADQQNDDLARDNRRLHARVEELLVQIAQLMTKQRDDRDV